MSSFNFELSEKRVYDFRRQLHCLLLSVYDEYENNAELAKDLEVVEEAVRLIKGRPFPSLASVLTYADNLGYRFDVKLVKKEDFNASS